MDNGRQQNYWPGFVDAFSNLVLTLVFVMTIFILALFYLSSKVAQGKLDALCPETKTELAQVKKELVDARNALRLAQEQILTLKKEPNRSNAAPAPSSLLDRRVDINVKSGRAPGSNRVSTEASGNGSAITIRFTAGVVDLDDGAKEVLDKVLSPFMAEKLRIKISLNAIPGPETYSEGRRLSFFRAVSVRNYMISKGIANSSIESKVAEHGNRDAGDPDGRVVILLQRAAQ